MEVSEPARIRSSDPPNMMMGSETYSSSYQNSTSMGAPPSRGVIQHTRPAFGSSVSSPTKTTDSGLHFRTEPTMSILSMSEPIKKKRGRPRKYGPDGSMAVALSPLSSTPGSYSAPMFKRNRGRPPGTGKRQQMHALGTAGIGFTPHVLTVKVGEDVATKIMSFSQQGPRAVCVVSANGAISNVTLRQPATSGGTVTYEGRFEIISLSGSFLFNDSDGTRSRTGGLSVSLAGPDGRVLGGGVAGLLMAATPVQVVVGSFIPEGKKPRVRPHPLSDPTSVPMQPSGHGASTGAAQPAPMPPLGAAAGPVSPPSRGTMSESSEDPGSPMNHSDVVTSNNNVSHHAHQNMPPQTASWQAQATANRSHQAEAV